jgi:unsaturated rhamnogalacturonyl hydrolase
VGAFLLAGSEMEQAGTEALGHGKTALVDAWFNSQTRKNAAGQTELFHYKWDDDANSGFAFFGRAFQRYGVRLATEVSAPTAVDLKRAQIMCWLRRISLRKILRPILWIRSVRM